MTPLVAIVGRPNVGKSTLFNRLVGAPIAIVEDTPGVTRDRHYAEGDIFGRRVLYVDTGGFDPESDDPMTEGIVRQVRLAVEQADVVVCVFDGQNELTGPDREAVGLLRVAGRPTLFVANKIDNPEASFAALDAYRLGIDALHPVSALHGRGVGRLLDALVEKLPPPVEETPAPPSAIRVAIIGRPNVGKSSLVNHYLGIDRMLVDDRPGTTRDSIDTILTTPEQSYVLVDTAGIRRKSRVEAPIERSSVLRALRALERSDVVVLLVDAEEELAEQDARLIGIAEERGVGLVLGFNKMDLAGAETAARRSLRRQVSDQLAFAPWVPVVFLSARTGRGTEALLRTVREVALSRNQRIPTGQLNRFFQTVLETHPPPSDRGRLVRLYYVTQVSVAPPTFVVAANRPGAVHASYQRYVVKQLREKFGFEGSPIRVHYRGRRRRSNESATRR